MLPTIRNSLGGILQIAVHQSVTEPERHRQIRELIQRNANASSVTELAQIANEIAPYVNMSLSHRQARLVNALLMVYGNVSPVSEAEEAELLRSLASTC